jgi:hypothetical protein
VAQAGEFLLYMHKTLNSNSSSTRKNAKMVKDNSIVYETLNGLTEVSLTDTI